MYLCDFGIFYLCYSQFALCNCFPILLVWSVTQKQTFFFFLNSKQIVTNPPNLASKASCHIRNYFNCRLFKLMILFQAGDSYKYFCLGTYSPLWLWSKSCPGEQQQREVRRDQRTALRNAFFPCRIGGTGAWSARGCELFSRNQSHIACQCNHITSFAVLMDISKREVGDVRLMIFEGFCF